MARNTHRQPFTEKPLYMGYKLHTSRTERQVWQAYRSLTLAVAHLDRVKQLLTDASKSESYAVHAASYRNLCGMRVFQCLLMLMTATHLLTNGQPGTLGIIQQKQTESWRKLASYLEQRLAQGSKISTRPAAKAVRTKAGSHRPSRSVTKTRKILNNRDSFLSS